MNAPTRLITLKNIQNYDLTTQFPIFKKHYFYSKSTLLNNHSNSFIGQVSARVQFFLLIKDAHVRFRLCGRVRAFYGGNIFKSHRNIAYIRTI